MKDKGPPRGDGIVYSSAHGRMCPRCGKPAAECACREARGAVPDGRKIRVRRETKGRRGKVVTIVSGLPLPPPELKELGRKLKSTCGAGGTVRDGAVEIQGYHVTKLLDELGRLGFEAKRG